MRVGSPSPQNFGAGVDFNLPGSAELKADYVIPFACASGCFRANVPPNSDKVIGSVWHTTLCFLFQLSLVIPDLSLLSMHI